MNSIKRALQVQAQHGAVVQGVCWSVEDFMLDEEHGVLCAELGPEAEYRIWVESFCFQERLPAIH